MTIQGNVSVVIPTLGGKILKQTISNINSGTLVPKEIFLVIPKIFEDNIPVFEGSNIKIIKTREQGQVHQRAYGFKKTTHDLVLQLDDDVWLNKTCLEKLVKSILSQNNKCCIAPKISNRNNLIPKNVMKSLFRTKQQKNFGIVKKTGEAISVPESFSTDKPIKVDWIPGGCILHRKKNLISENFFPFKGKAYCEDLIHSFLLRNMNVMLLVDTSASCNTEIEGEDKKKFINFFQELKKDLQARKFFMKKFKIYSNKIYYYYLYRILVYCVKKVF